MLAAWQWLKKCMVKAFVKSVFFGSLIGCAPFLIVTVISAIAEAVDGMQGGDGIWTMLWFAILPMMISLPVVLVSSLVFGLPLTFFLRRRRVESGGAYVGAGIAFGALVPVVGALLLGSLGLAVLGILGSFAGAATAHVWWRAIDNSDKDSL